MRLRNPLKLLRSTSFAVDAGSSRTVITTATGDVLLDEPTVIAIDQDNNSVLATGAEAKSFLGKAPERIRVTKPIVGGVIVDFDAAKRLMQTFFKRVLPNDGSRVTICACVNCGITALEKRTFADCFKAAGISKAHLLSAPLAAALGAVMDIRAANGSLLLGIGGALAEVSAICLSDIVHCQSQPLGAGCFHAAVSHHFAATHQVAIGENMAEQVTCQLASALPDGPSRAFTVTGKNSMTGTPCALDLTEADLRGVLDTPLAELAGMVRGVMEKLPAELVADIADSGLHLYGGGARLSGVAEWFARELNLRCRVVGEPELVQVRGAAATLRPDLGYKDLLGK